MFKILAVLSTYNYILDFTITTRYYIWIILINSSMWNKNGVSVSIIYVPKSSIDSRSEKMSTNVVRLKERDKSEIIMLYNV